ncbi:hypothetical protein [Roseomonas marmotae]|uniref:Uncharacterized protein n=1 Tax=Roseomonas marmotae TaxID=2768161 RepID=A0ABS3K8B6_9PROT|nr:hypothetical protein [Roseomonas marmotae]MBO1073247.1 hypothetical protein [Roseomonas marmotae]QTI79129.1 hypothetical protein IAI58_16105 [Roseomonas marmotae]
MTAVILPFIRPAARALSNRPKPAITPAEQQEARNWAQGLGPQWQVDLATGGPDVALSIRTPRCDAPAPAEDEPCQPWILARNDNGFVILEDGWLERGTFATLTAALARILVLETRLAAAG